MRKNWYFNRVGYTNRALFEGDPPAPDPAAEAIAAAVKEATTAAEERIARMKTELDAVSTKANLTAQERADLEKRLQNSDSEKKTETTRLERELNTTKQKAKEEREAAEKDRDSWKNRFTESTIIGRITDASAKGNAFSSDQLVAILRPNARLEPVLGEDSKPTGEFEVKVKFVDVDPKDPKKTVTLDMSPEQVVTRMRERDDYKNLFKAVTNGGIGGSNNKNGGPNQKDLAQLIREGKMDEYREATRPAKKG